jgi:hypothetical protein
MAVLCGKCGARLASRGSLAGHFRRAHGRRGKVRRPAALVSAMPNPGAHPGPIRAEVLDVTPARAEIVPVRPLPARPARALPDSSDSEGPPSWWEPQGDPEWRRTVWAGFPADYRNGLLAARAGPAFTIRPPEASDRVILWSQYHVLRALATRLDAGIGTERERAAFEAGLREYSANYDRIRAERKALPG